MFHVAGWAKLRAETARRKAAEEERTRLLLHAKALENLSTTATHKAGKAADQEVIALRKERAARDTARRAVRSKTEAEERVVVALQLQRDTLRDTRRLIVQKCRLKKKKESAELAVGGLVDEHTRLLRAYRGESEKLQVVQLPLNDLNFLRCYTHE